MANHSGNGIDGPGGFVLLLFVCLVLYAVFVY